MIVIILCENPIPWFYYSIRLNAAYLLAFARKPGLTDNNLLLMHYNLHITTIHLFFIESIIIHHRLSFE